MKVATDGNDVLVVQDSQSACDPRFVYFDMKCRALSMNSLDCLVYGS